MLKYAIWNKIYTTLTNRLRDSQSSMKVEFEQTNLHSCCKYCQRIEAKWVVERPDLVHEYRSNVLKKF